MARKISNAKKGSVVELSGEYKYTPNLDSQYRNGIPVTKNIKIVGKNGCIINGNGKARALDVNPNCKITVSHIKFKNGHTNHNNGGAIYLHSKSKLTVKNCVFTKNDAYKANGGVISGEYKNTLKIYHSKFYKNRAIRASDKSWPSDQRGMGGAISLNIGSKLTLSHTVFKKNQGYLSVILVMSHSDKGTKTSTVDVRNSLFEENAAVINGAFYLDEYGKGKFIKTTFKKNYSKNKGGTLILDASKYVLVKNCRFEGNLGVFGGAIDLYKYKGKVSHVFVVGCSFIKNKAWESGGAIFSDYGKLKITKSKFIGNRAEISGGAVEVRGGKLNLVKPVFKKNYAQCGGALLVKNKKAIHLYKGKFANNIATVNGKNILGIYDDCVSKIKILT